MNDTKTLPPADVTVISPPARESVMARFEVLVASEKQRIREQIDAACELVRTQSEQRIQEIQKRGAEEIAEMDRRLAQIEQDVPDPVGRDPYSKTPDWAADQVLDKKVPHFMSAQEDGSEDEGAES